jgi:hypothetical protein
MRTLNDLQPWALRAFESAYSDLSKRREKCSPEDFAGGFIAALAWSRSSSSFKVDDQPD